MTSSSRPPVLETMPTARSGAAGVRRRQGRRPGCWRRARPSSKPRQRSRSATMATGRRVHVPGRGGEATVPGASPAGRTAGRADRPPVGPRRWPDARRPPTTRPPAQRSPMERRAGTTRSVSTPAGSEPTARRVSTNHQAPAPSPASMRASRPRRADAVILGGRVRTRRAAGPGEPSTSAGRTRHWVPSRVAGRRPSRT